MVIDAREMKLLELFSKLKTLFEARCGHEVAVEVMIGTYRDSKRITAFASMSGCQTNTEKKEGYYIVRISGNVCCV